VTVEEIATWYSVRGLTARVSNANIMVCPSKPRMTKRIIRNNGHQNNRKNTEDKKVEPIDFMENSDGFSALNLLINSRESSHFDEKRYNSTQITPEGR